MKKELNKKPNNYLQDSFGNKSSKRLWGSIVLGLGITMGVGLFVHSLFEVAADPKTAYGIIEAFFWGGCALLGIGVGEKFKFNK